MNKAQISLIRTLCELACARIDNLYSLEGAHEEKEALKRWLQAVFPNDWDEII